MGKAEKKPDFTIESPTRSPNLSIIGSTGGFWRGKRGGHKNVRLKDVWEAARHFGYLLHSCATKWLPHIPRIKRLTHFLERVKHGVSVLRRAGGCGYQKPYWKEDNRQVSSHSLKPLASSPLDPQHDGRQFFTLQAEGCISILWRLWLAQEKTLKIYPKCPNGMTQLHNSIAKLITSTSSCRHGASTHFMLTMH